MAQPLPFEILLGIYLGILTGMFPALVAWGLGFIVRYVTGVTVPAFAVVVLAMALAGISGGLLALTDATVLESGYRIVVALVVVMMLGLYAHAKGDAMGAEMPRRFSLRTLRDRTLSADVVDLVGARGEVRVEVVGDVVDMEGYPPLSEEVRREITAGDWRLPADLPISELEVRFADRLRTELDLADVSVTIDERGRATVVAAPPLSGLSKRVPAGKRAVSVEALVPTGMARGDEVVVLADGHQVEGTVVSARSGPRTDDRGRGGPGGAGGPPSRSATGAGSTGGAGGSPRTDGGAGAGGDDQPPSPAAPQTTTGGEGRVTVAVSRVDAKHLLSVQRGRVVVTARGTRREFELLSLLRRAGKRFRKVAVRAGGDLDDTTIGHADIRERHGVAVLAVKRPDGWTVAPHGSTALSAGDELFVVGTHDALEGFQEVAG